MGENLSSKGQRSGSLKTKM